MPKKFDDVIPPEKKKSIRDIPIPESRRASISTPPPSTSSVTPTVPKDFYSPSIRDTLDKKNYTQLGKFSTSTETTRIAKKPRRKIWLILILALVVIVFALLSVYDGATLSYMPKAINLTFSDDIYKAYRSGEDNLIYSVIKLSKDRGTNIVATGAEVDVVRKASGTIVVYNDATTEPQKLVATTRFETPSGLVYRVQTDVTVPGKRTVNGTNQPGSIEVMVYADEGGTKYNIGLSDFTLPGLKGTPRYSTIYARSKTAMTGGFAGKEKQVDNTEKEKAKQELGAALREELLSEAQAQVPSDFIMIPALSAVSFEELPQTAGSGNNEVVVNLRANLNAIMFKRTDLSRHLAGGKTTLLENESVDLKSLDSLSFVFEEHPGGDLTTVNEISFTATGNTPLVWLTDELALKTDLAGKSRDEVPTILNNYPTIVSATATLRPFWKSTFPEEVDKIIMKQIPTE